MKYAFVETHLRAYPLALACDTLGVCASGYHAWKNRTPVPRTLEQQRLLFLIKTIHNGLGGINDAPRIFAVLKAEHGYGGSGHAQLLRRVPPAAEHEWQGKLL